MNLEEFEQILLDPNVSDEEVTRVFNEFDNNDDIHTCQKAESLFLRIRTEAHQADMQTRGISRIKALHEYCSSQGVEK